MQIKNATQTGNFQAKKQSIPPPFKGFLKIPIEIANKVERQDVFYKTLDWAAPFGNSQEHAKRFGYVLQVVCHYEDALVEYLNKVIGKDNYALEKFKSKESDFRLSFRRYNEEMDLTEKMGNLEDFIETYKNDTKKDVVESVAKKVDELNKLKQAMQIKKN